MADALLHAELLAACSALGYSDGVKYYKEADCLETIKDLVRYLRKDDESHETRRVLGETRVVQTDLLPIIRDHGQEAELFEITVRLLVNLTNPALLLFREELPEEKVTRQQFLQLISQQQGYKGAFIDDKLWGVLVGRLGELLQLEWEERQEEDKMLIERILILVRNVLSVPASPEEEKRTDDDASVHDQVLWALHLSGFEDLLLYVASSEREQELCMHVLEIISLMLREQDASQLAAADIGRSRTEKERDQKELLELRQREAAYRRQRKNKHYGARHSRFGGTYYVQNMKSISDRDLISHRPLTDLRSLDLDRAKRPKKINKNNEPLIDCSVTRRSTLAIRLFLQEFCVEFLNGAYNSIMYAVKDNLDRARAQDHDESYYLWAIKFFMEFNRHHQFKVELVSETLSVQTVHYIQTNLETYYETMTTDKKKIPLWSRRMHRALGAYRELLSTLAAMDRSESESVRESSKVLESKVFYVVEYRELVLTLLQVYNPKKMTPTYLKDLIETTHIFLKLLEGFCGKRKRLMVQKVKKVGKKKTATKKTTDGQLTEDKLQDLWDEMSSELSAVVQGEAGDLPDTIPFDTLSEAAEEDQKESAMRRINKLLRNKEMAEAVSLMRSSREVWPEGNIFGPDGMDASEEFLALREIFMADLNPAEGEEPPEEEYDEEEQEEEEEVRVRITEQEFDFLGFLRRFANTNVMQSYGRLFKRYQSNSAHTNHCILKMYHRIAWDAKLPAIFFQASLFCVFQRAMEDPRRSSDESVREIGKFGKYIFRQFLKVAENSTKVYVELLFWKTNRDAVEIECGYEEQGGKVATKKAWREEEEDELHRLFEEFKDVPAEERVGKDTVDLILQNLINQTRTRRMVIKKLKDMGLVTHINEVKRKPLKLKCPRVWSEEEEEELKMLFEEHKGAMDVVGRIMDNTMEKRPKHRIIEKILELGLVSDRKELYKKRPTKAKPRVDMRSRGELFLAANRGSESDDSGRERGDESLDESHVAKKPSRRPAYVPPVATPALISQALNAVLEGNMQEAVEWMAGILQDVADDREEDGDFEPVPVLAITAACTDAMEDDAFHKLLKLVGIRPPQSHEEMFWRVPSRLSVAALRDRAQYLRQGMAGGIIDMENADVPLEPVEEEEEDTKKKKKKRSSKEPKRKQSKPKTPKRNKSPENNNLQDDFSDSENLDPEDKENFNRKPRASGGDDGMVPLAARTPQRVEDSSDDDIPLTFLSGDPTPSSSKARGPKRRIVSDPEKSDGNSEKASTRGKKSKKKRRLILNDDSDEEEGEVEDSPVVESHALVLRLDTESTETEKRAGGIGSTVDRATQKPSQSRRMLDSDSEGENIPSFSEKQRPRAIIDSDDE
ncbi:protein timeless homolog [Homarus americanus]|uniref:protein timeless homolog n=1 Tax=Homarus americanus TaxID=6706 RepID=UPI001C473819|nr:protein timeless homolog [Homarus americanus]XP_042223790.1 protein timeless homolog [Homarus americanus]